MFSHCNNRLYVNVYNMINGVKYEYPQSKNFKISEKCNGNNIQILKRHNTHNTILQNTNILFSLVRFVIKKKV